jgi:hypothetical protein
MSATAIFVWLVSTPSSAMPFTAQTFMKRSVCRKCTLGLHGVTFGEALRVWTRVALLSFGGSACVIQAMAKPPANLLGSWSRPSAARLRFRLPRSPGRIARECRAHTGARLRLPICLHQQRAGSGRPIDAACPVLVSLSDERAKHSVDPNEVRVRVSIDNDGMSAIDAVDGSSTGARVP